MPPRKRSRRGGKSVSIVKQEDNSENLDQVIAWLEDFEMQFENRITNLDRMFAQKIKAVERFYEIERKKIPPDVGNSVLVLKNNEALKSEDTVTTKDSVQEADTTLKPRSRQRTRCLSVSSSRDSTEPRRVTRSSSLNWKEKVPVPIMIAPTIGKYKTPACKSTFASAPSLITPKVAPNAPLSMVRHPRQGEMAVSLSGSPLIVTSTLREQNANVNLRLADGRVVSLLPEPRLRPYEIPEVDEETRQQLLTLREHMSVLINMTHN